MKTNYDLAVIITARNEEFLSKTVDDVIAKKRGKTEVIVVLDGSWANPPIKKHPDVTILYNKDSIGQRAGINQAVRLSSAEFIMKLDAHCIVSEGFDEVLVKDGRKLGKNVTQVPRMYNLHAFNWRCKKCGNEWYQGPSPDHCMQPGEKRRINEGCNSKEFERVIIWQPRFHRQSDSMVFDNTLHFQYWGEFTKRPEAQADISDTFSLVGACFVMNRERYWELGGSDEEHGSWGQQGTEVACKTWLSGGRLVVNKRCWFAHLFRTQGKDFGFPYKHKDGAIEKARQYSQDLWFNNKWDKAIRPLSWLLEKFWPVKGWTEADLVKIGGKVPVKEKGIIYYTDNQLKLSIARGVQRQLKLMYLPIVSSSLKPMVLGKNIVVNGKRGYMTMFKQILSALEASETEYVFFCEHDVLYHPTHFLFKPEKKGVWYYNTNIVKVDAKTGKTVQVDDCKQVSGICVDRETAIKHYKKRVSLLEEYLFLNKGNPKIEEDFNRYVRKMGFEPGTHNRPERVDDSTCEVWRSEYPNIDIRHDNNLTESRWEKDKFRNEKFVKGWKEDHIYNIPGWEKSDHDFYIIRLP